MIVVLALLSMSTASAQPSAEERAREHFERGLEQYDAGFFPAALAEFDAAYALSPNVAILYNLGRVHTQLGDWVKAVSAFERFLAGGEAETRRRRREVERLLAEARSRVGRLWVETNIEGAVIAIGGSDVATTPLTQAIPVNAGEVAIAARATGHDTASQTISIAGGEERTVRLELRPLMERRGALRISSVPEGVEISVDGAFVGVTPINETHLVSPGPHVVEGRRRGYRAARAEVLVADRGDHGVPLELEVDENSPDRDFGELALVLPLAPTSLVIDGRSYDAGRDIRLPIGRHRVRIEVPERDEVDQAIEIASGETLTLAPSFVWTDAARAERRSSASGQRVLGWVFGAAGLGVAIAGVVGLLLADGMVDDALGDRIRFCELPENRGTLMCSPDGGFDINVARETYNDGVDRSNFARVVSFIGIGAGVAALGAGAVLVLLAPSDHSIDEDASEREARLELRISPTGIMLGGVF